MKLLFLIFLLTTSVKTVESAVATRLKDLVSVRGVRSNPLIGYGLVIGLNGTGDGGGEITNSSLKRMFQKLGLNPQQELSSKNAAAVIVTANLLPFARAGQKLDATVSSIADAKSLAGGTLLMTPLKGGDGKVYALASGAISIGGLDAGKKFPTIGKIPDGVSVEAELELNFNKKKSLRLALNNPDFTTAARVEKTINQELGGKYAAARDATTIDLTVPTFYERKVVNLLALIENFKVISDNKSKVVINERTGTIVAGGNVTLKSAAISHGNLSIEVGGAGGNAGGGKALHLVGPAATLNDLVKALNALGTSAEDLIAIFQVLKQNGVLIGEVEFI